MRISRLAPAIVVAVVLVATSACSSKGNNSSDSANAAVSWTQINQEYQKEVASFPYQLPPGVSFPKNVTTSNDAQQSLYQLGWGQMQAYLYAECAQQKVALDNQTSDPAKASAALAAIEKIDQSPVYVKHFDDPDGVWQGIIAKAKLGDYTELSQQFQSNCSGAWFEGKQS
ncbi:MAG: hypothetical protein FWF75_09360 [Propionibacteriaceae bacterium]|nr:hypothetical protein [Propionibacteriaceae bacterium]